jgi:thiol-disulfide isomerase/thioredoxin
VVGAVAAAAGAGAAWWFGGPAPASAPVPQRLWDQRFARPGGGDLVMSDWRGRPLVINFWATWCAPCVSELPALDRFHKTQGEQGWRVIAIAIDGPEQVREFLRRLPVTMPVGIAGVAAMELARELGNRQGALPFTVCVAPSGRIVWQKLGETNFDELRGLVSRLSS